MSLLLYRVWECSYIIDLHVAVQFFQCHLLDCVISIVYSCLLCCKLSVGVWVYFWALYSVPLIYMSLLMPVSHCFNYCSFIVQSEVCKGYACCASSYVFQKGLFKLPLPEHFGKFLMGIMEGKTDLIFFTTKINYFIVFFL